MISEIQQERMDKAYRFILRYRETEGISPTIREVQDYLGVASSSTAYEVVKNLRRTGKITMKRNTPRTMKIRNKRGSIQGEH